MSLYTKTQCVEHNTYLGFIYFENKDGNTTSTWLLDTPYYIEYDTRVAGYLQTTSNITLLDKYTFPSCNWVPMSSTKNNLLRVGTLYLHCDPSDCPSTGIDAVTNEVRQILLNNYPTQEIALAVVIPFVALFFLVFCMFGCYKWK